VKRLLQALLLAALVALPSVGWTQTYPNKSIRLVVPYPPGGGADLLARAIGKKLGEDLKQSVVVENRPGAGGSIGTAAVAMAPADGYTLLMASPSHSINGALYKNLSFDAEKDFTGVILCASGPLVLVVNTSFPANTMEEFIAMAKAKPGQINYASAGIGSSPHLAGELFKNKAKLDLSHVAYKGTSPALTDLLGGQVQAFFAPVPTVLEFVKGGRLKALGVTTRLPFAALPGVPAIARTVPGFDMIQWWGIVAPAATPKSIVTMLNAEIARILASADMKEKLVAMGADPGGNSPQNFDRLIHEEVLKWTEVINTAKVKAE
jgi:tripartite-type tricarboxylate transporter receptor subunit TctC